MEETTMPVTTETFVTTDLRARGINRFDGEGRPAGGSVEGVGINIDWQDGPLGRDDDRKAPNGAFIETILEAVAERLAFYQRSPFACVENAVALDHVADALAVLRARTAAREARQVEGTHVP
jgi:hypothetical protein